MNKVIDPDSFQLSLAKPCSISSRAGAENLKQVIQGKYHSFSLQAITSSSLGTPHGPYYGIKNERIEEGDKTAAAKLLHQKKLNLSPLPPKPSSVRVKRPSKLDSQSILEALPSVLSRLLRIKSDLHPPLLKFEASPEAASHNWDLLKKNNFNLSQLLNPPDRCVTNYGSEFKSTADLEPLLIHHPRWIELKSRLDNGVSFPLTTLDESIRIQDLKQAYKRGNHKSAKIEESHLANAIEK